MCKTAQSRLCSHSHNVAKHGFLNSASQVCVKQHSVAPRELLLNGSCRYDDRQRA